jgi:hypothetical protein
MTTFSAIDTKANEIKEKRKSLIISSFGGRPQSYISKQTNIDQVKLNKWVNNAGNLEDAELDRLSKYLGVDFK